MGQRHSSITEVSVLHSMEIMLKNKNKNIRNCVLCALSLKLTTFHTIPV